MIQQRTIEHTDIAKNVNKYVVPRVPQVGVSHRTLPLNGTCHIPEDNIVDCETFSTGLNVTTSYNLDDRD